MARQTPQKNAVESEWETAEGNVGRLQDFLTSAITEETNYVDRSDRDAIIAYINYLEHSAKERRSRLRVAEANLARVRKERDSSRNEKRKLLQELKDTNTELEHTKNCLVEKKEFEQAMAELKESFDAL